MEHQNIKQNQVKSKQLLGSLDQCGQRSQYHNLVDVLFVLDATCSMTWCMDQMKNTVTKIMDKFSDQQYNIKFAIQLYRDHPPMEYSFVQQHFDLMSYKQILNVIDEQCQAAGGGDIPEAVFDGLVRGLQKTSWRISIDGKTKSKRFLFHGCDAPPHGLEYGYKSDTEGWSQNGCPCGLTRHDVKTLLDKINVDYSIIKCGNKADIMAGLFKQCFADKFKRQIQIQQHKPEQYKSISFLKSIKNASKPPQQLYYKKSQKQFQQEHDKHQEPPSMANQIAEEMQAGLFGFFD